MAAVLAVRAKQEEMGEAVVAAEEAIAHRVERREVSAALLARGRVIGLMAATPVGLTPIAVQAAALLAVGDKVALGHAAMGLAFPEQHLVGRVVLVRPDQVHRVDRREVRVTAEIGRSAEVTAQTVAVGRIVEMTRVNRIEEVIDEEMTAVPVRETSVGVTATAAVGVLEADKVKVAEALAAHLVPSGRNGRGKIAGRHAKSVKPVSRETKLSVEQRR